MEISKITNSEIGSSHWFITLTSKCKRIGEFMMDHSITEEQRKLWGAELYEATKELIKSHSKSNPKKYLQVTLDIEYIGNKEEAIKLLNKNFTQQHAIYGASSNEYASLFPRTIKEVLTI